MVEADRDWRVLIWQQMLDQEMFQGAGLIVWLEEALGQLWAWQGVSVSCLVLRAGARCLEQVSWEWRYVGLCD